MVTSRIQKLIGRGTALVLFTLMPAFAAADFPVIFTADSSETSEAVVWNSVRGEYFVVYEKVQAPVGIPFWEGRRLDRNGVAVAPPVVLPLGWPHDQPNITYNENLDQYMLVAANNGMFGSPGVDGFILDGTGSLVWSDNVLAGDYDYSDGTGCPGVAYNSVLGEYLVAASLDTGSSSGLKEIYVQAVLEGGGLVGSQIKASDGPFATLSAPALAYAPISSVETPGGRYLLAFAWGTSGWTIMLDSYGTPINTLWNCGTQQPFSADVPIDWGTVNGQIYHPDVAYGEVDGQKSFLVVWEDHNNTNPNNGAEPWSGVWGFLVDADVLMYCNGLSGATPISGICDHFFDDWLPQVDYDATTEAFQVAWYETGSNDGCNLPEWRYYHIRGTYVDYDFRVPPHTNKVLSQTTGGWPGNEDPNRPHIACGPGGSSLVVWDDARNSGSNNYRDIYGTIFAPEAMLADVSTPEINGFDVSHGVAWGDYDNDGDHDLYLSNWAGPNKLFRNDGGTLSNVSGPPTDDAGLGFGVSWGDADGDSDLDLYLVNDGANVYFDNGAGVLTNATAPPLGDSGVGFAASWVDYDSDGDLDIYLAILGAANRLLQNNGLGGFTNVATGALADTSDTHAAIWGDYDDDGDQDVYLANSGSANKLLRNNGAGSFTDVTSAPLTDAGQARGASWADYDNDGDLDLYLANNGGANFLFENQGSGVFFDITSGLLGDALDSHSPMWADFENDGDLDLYLSNFNGPNRLFRNDGFTSFTDIALWPYDDPGATGGAAWADMDDDGDMDLFTANSFWQPNRLYRNELFSGNGWYQVDLEGTASNSFGVGARIRVVAGGASQIREVTAGSGFCSMNSLTVEFGLGAAGVIDTVEVSWPSGTVQILTAVAINQRMTITEQSQVSVAGGTDAVPAATRAYPSAPNPFNPVTTIRFELPAVSPVQLDIYDIRGRLVRRLLDREPQAAGSHTITWDGRTDSGNPVPSGAYFYRFLAPGYETTHRMTLVR